VLLRSSRAVTLVVASLVAIGCASSAEAPRALDAAPPAAPPVASPRAPASVAPTSSSGPAPARRVPADAAECQAMLGTPEAARSDATVTPERGSGKSERFAGIVAAIKSQRGALRCCYDLWA